MHAKKTHLCTSTQEVEGMSLTSTQLTSFSNNKRVLLLLIYAKHNVNGGLLYDNVFKTVSKCTIHDVLCQPTLNTL
ncbi:hypothetical protein PGIGA_G00096970 [Pangasianodon gigas]|uniref:Uncharacterized protein n=1 Tax=Pangasianodon gigas TaxID=30993 RepID=A0ACC5XDG0_PANGG|nr:hypothetical protein [Pangasianodon gigas]